MHVTLWPFCSQQDKRTGKFLLASDSGVLWYSYLASKLQAAVVLPMEYQCEDELRFLMELRSWVPSSNLYRRLHWDTVLMERVAEQESPVLTLHELIACPLKTLHPKLRVVCEHAFDVKSAWPETAELFPLAWRAADLVHCPTEALRQEVLRAGGNGVVWPVPYDSDVFRPSTAPRDIDVLFNSRASSTGYTNHEVFVRSMLFCGLRIVCTDPTGYMALTNACPHTWLRRVLRARYPSLLARSRAVVCLTDNGTVPTALKEAVASGCAAVVLDRPQYREFFGEKYPYFCTLNTVLGITRRALDRGPTPIPAALAECTYEASLKRVKEALQ